MDISEVLTLGEALVGQLVAIEGRFCGDIQSERCVLIIPQNNGSRHPVQGIPVLCPGLTKLLSEPPYAAYVLPAPGGRYALGGMASISGIIVALSEPASTLMDISSLSATIAVASITSLIFHKRSIDVEVALGDIGKTA